jgi:hypothetical protein
MIMGSEATLKSVSTDWQKTSRSNAEGVIEFVHTPDADRSGNIRFHRSHIEPRLIRFPVDHRVARTVLPSASSIFSCNSTVMWNRRLCCLPSA